MYLLGSVLFLLTYEVLDSTPDRNWNTIWRLIVAEYKANRVGVQYTNMTVLSFSNKKAPLKYYPKLKGKGAEVRDLVLPVLNVWKRFQKGTEQHLKIMSCLECQVELQAVLHAHASEVFLPPPSCKRFEALVVTFLQDYSILANMADREGKLLFSVTIKFHYLHHLAQRAWFLNPRKGCCMIDEDFVGQCKDLVAACCHGTEAHMVPLRFTERYCWGMYINMMYPLEELRPWTGGGAATLD